MIWTVKYSNDQVRVYLSELLSDECKIFFKTNDQWKEIYCGSISLLESFHKAYIAVCEIQDAASGDDNAPDFKIEYDDNGIDVMDKVNAALAKTGLSFVTDEELHDGFQPYWLERGKA